MSDESARNPGARIVFWTWAVIIFGGLATMLALPLLGR